MDSKLIDSNQVSIRFPLQGGSEYNFVLDPLFAQIDPSSSKVSVMSTKIEVTLRKQTRGQKWASLEAPLGSKNTLTVTSPTPATNASSSGTSTNPAGPAYPTSSRQGTKNWDKIATDLTQNKKKKSKKTADKENPSKTPSTSDNGEEDSGAESADSDYNGGDPVDSFFKKLYSNADADTRRAMVKSFTESEGTALSTNWSEVEKEKVEVRPPSQD